MLVQLLLHLPILVVSGSVKINAAGTGASATATVSTELADGKYTVVEIHMREWLQIHLVLINESGDLVASIRMNALVFKLMQIVGKQY